MNNINFMKSENEFPIQRVAVPLYYADSVNHCSSCGHTHWHIGRISAECAFCHDAIPLAQATYPSINELAGMDELLTAA